MTKIPFNKPHLTGIEQERIREVFESHHLSGNGNFTKKCHQFFETNYSFKKCLLTTSCTDALEMAAILINVQPGDEIIMPSYTFVSTANAFVLRGAKIIFTDSRIDHPGMDEKQIESLITEKTKAIVPVHYAGVACNMDLIMGIADKYDLFVIEDAAQAFDSFFIDKNGQKKALGSIGHFGAFSFHETKNIQSGEGGMLVINDENFFERAEIIWEKGTNRSAFHRGEIDKYGWVDIGSSFLPSEIIAAFLYAQLENGRAIQTRRIENWNAYYRNLQELDQQKFRLPVVPEYATNNAHMFYIVAENEFQRTKIINFFRENGVSAVFHYLSLHSSKYYREKHFGGRLEQSELYSHCLLRLPFFYSLSEGDIEKVVNLIKRIVV